MIANRRDEVLEILRRHKAEFANRYGVTALGVFGSVSRDEAGKESDVDIVFETDTPKVMSLVLAWSYFYKLYEPNSDLARNFLVIAPNIIVLDRIYKDDPG